MATYVCGAADGGFGPLNAERTDLTDCFQTVVVLAPVALTFLIVAPIRLAIVPRGVPVKPFPRTPQMTLLFLALLAIAHAFYYALTQSSIAVYMIVEPVIEVAALVAVIAMIRAEHAADQYSLVFPAFAVAYTAVSVKLIETVIVVVFVSAASFSASFVVFGLRFALCLVVCHYANKVSTARKQRSAAANSATDGAYQLSEYESQPAESSTVSKRGWFSWPKGAAAAGNTSAGNRSINADHRIDVHSPNDTVSSVATSSHHAVTQSLITSHALSGAVLTIPNFQQSLVGTGTRQTLSVQYGVRLKLRHDHWVSGDDDMDTFTTWKKYREFSGLHDGIVLSASKYGLTPPTFPPAPKKGHYNEGVQQLQTYMQAVIAQPLYWDDVAAFVSLNDRLTSIAAYKANPPANTPQPPILIAPVKKPPTAPAASDIKVAARNDHRIDYDWTIISVSVVGWSRWEEDTIDEDNTTNTPASKKKGKSSRTASRTASPMSTPRLGGRKGERVVSPVGTAKTYLTLTIPVKTTVASGSSPNA